jgi:hypothetical protein
MDKCCEGDKGFEKFYIAERVFYTWWCGVMSPAFRPPPSLALPPSSFAKAMEDKQRGGKGDSLKTKHTHSLPGGGGLGWGNRRNLSSRPAARKGRSDLSYFLSAFSTSAGFLPEGCLAL